MTPDHHAPGPGSPPERPAPDLLVLAAGFGTRYGGLKQLDGVGPGGAALLDYGVADAARAGFGKAVVVVRAAIRDQVWAHVERTVAARVPVELVDQELADLPGGWTPPPSRTRPWGTAHAVWAAREALEGPFVMANADDHYGPHAYRTLADHLSAADDVPSWALAGYRLGDVLSPHGPVNRGICRVDEAGCLEDVFEGKELERTADGTVRGRSESGEPLELAPDRLVSTNLWAFTPDVFPFLERGIDAFMERRGREPGAECLIPELVRRELGEGGCRVRVRPTHGRFFGVTHREDRAEVVRLLAERGPPWAGERRPVGDADGGRGDGGRRE